MTMFCIWHFTKHVFKPENNLIVLRLLQRKVSFVRLGKQYKT